jgi:probable F420-dependent oxidoreductase
MDTGVGIFPTHDGIDPGALARLVEERGHGGIYFPEHTHIPAVRRSKWPGGEGELPRKYAHTYDIFVAMTAAAVTTRRLRIGSAVCLVSERDAIITAKQVASIDVLSGGRVDFGVGCGWNREELVNHGIDPRRRFDVMRERVQAMKAIWTEDEASYSGAHGSFERIWCWPKPLQRPHVPVLLGGNGPTVLDRVLAYADAWFPTHNRPNVAEMIQELGVRARDAGRRIPVLVIGLPPDPRVIERYEALGVERAIMWLPSAARGPVERALERFEAAVAEAHGE